MDVRPRCFVWPKPDYRPEGAKVYKVLFAAPFLGALTGLIMLLPIVIGAEVAGYTTRETGKIPPLIWGEMVAIGILLGVCGTAVAEYFFQVRYKVKFWLDGNVVILHGPDRPKSKRKEWHNWRGFNALSSSPADDGKSFLHFVHKDGWFAYLPDSYHPSDASYLHQQINSMLEEMQEARRERGDYKIFMWNVPDRTFLLRLCMAIVASVPFGALAFVYGPSFLPEPNALFLRNLIKEFTLITGLTSQTYPHLLSAVTTLLVGLLAYKIVSRTKYYGAFFFPNGEFIAREIRKRRAHDRPDKWRTFAKLEKTSKAGFNRLRFEREDGTFFDLPSRLRKRQAERVRQKIQELWDIMNDGQNMPPPAPEAIGVPAETEIMSATITASVTRKRYGV